VEAVPAFVGEAFFWVGLRHTPLASIYRLKSFIPHCYLCCGLQMKKTFFFDSQAANEEKNVFFSTRGLQMKKKRVFS
jgi:hypothetical protein